MTEQNMAPVPFERLDRMERMILDLTNRLDGATVTPAPEWLTISQAAKKMDVNRSTIHRWVEQGRIKATGAGKQRRVRIA